MANIQIIQGDFEKKLIMGLFIPVCIYISAFSFGQSDENITFAIDNQKTWKSI